MEMNYDNINDVSIGNIITQDAEETLILSTTSNRNVNERLIDIKNTPENINDDMRMDFYVYIDPLDSNTIGIIGAKKITIEYTYYYGGSSHTNIIKSIRSNVTSK